MIDRERISAYVSEIKVSLDNLKNYANCFELLVQTGKFKKETLNCMYKMAKFRNLLVHHYIKVDDERVYEKLSEIDCFERFIEELEVII